MCDHCLSSQKKIILTIADNVAGIVKLTVFAIPTRTVFADIFQVSLTIGRAKEFKGPATEIFKHYADYMRELLKNRA
ncbi:MAG: hypothetical protein MJ189_04805 [Coriobacteriales bacterium]|nr:hypothetical protein [Coriobacteriales bacterium]